MAPPLRHFRHIPPAEMSRLFHLPPQAFGIDDDREALAIGLGATLYLPATRPQIAADVVRQAGRGVTSMVVCLEDAIRDEDVPAAEANAAAQLRDLAADPRPRPLLFVRVRCPEQITTLVEQVGPAIEVLSGFVVPKFTGAVGPAYLDAAVAASARSGHHLYVMPVLESPEIIFRESRTSALVEVQQLLDKYRDQVLAVRIGATDLCAAFGLRRPIDVSIYEVRVVADVIGEIVNILGRADDRGFVVTGPVWEYFTTPERIFKPQLRSTPFVEHEPAASQLRDSLISHALDGLIREVVLDQANGLTGKTVIHPSHTETVHALSVVSHEEYQDAVDLLRPESSGGGVLTSGYANKMNEVKPHRAWARRVLRRAAAFGVIREDISYVDLLGIEAAR
jgi:citrate lyase beta subunit